VHTDRRSSASVLLDSSLELDINKRLQALNLQDTARVALKSFNRHILIVGQAPSEEIIDQISDIAAHTDGVRKVYNEITIGSPLSYWDKANDAWITAKITSAMVLDPQMSPWKIHVLTENGIVYLIGIVTPQEEEFAVNIAKSTSGVKKVVKIFEPKKS
jgi:osmotically-inducible protein OsmY